MRRPLLVGVVAVAIGLAVAWWTRRSPPGAITALRYGHGPYPAHLVHRGGTGDVPLCWAFYLLELGDRRVLIDTGVGSQEAVRTYRIEDYLPPDRVLAEAGVAADDVDDIILTHTHADHAGALDRFSAARVHLQRAGYERLRFAQDRIWSMVEVVEREGRLHLVDGEVELWPGLWLIPTGGHTRGSQAVRLMGDLQAVWVGDECYFEDACRAGAPLPPDALVDPRAHRAFLARLEPWLRLGAMPLTFHDPAPSRAPPCADARVVRLPRERHRTRGELVP